MCHHVSYPVAARKHVDSTAKSTTEVIPQAKIRSCHQAMSFLSSDALSVPDPAPDVGGSVVYNWKRNGTLRALGCVISAVAAGKNQLFLVARLSAPAESRMIAGLIR